MSNVIEFPSPPAASTDSDHAVSVWCADGRALVAHFVLGHEERTLRFDTYDEAMSQGRQLASEHNAELTYTNDTTATHKRSEADAPLHRQRFVQSLTRLKEQCLDLARVIDLELTGVRDGDGFWHGSDGLGGSIDNVTEACARVTRLRRGEPVATTVAASPSFGRPLDDEIPF
jgi:hypothetical protein